MQLCFSLQMMLAEAHKEGTLKCHARQNVVLELKCENVYILYDESIKLPSDYRGVEYIKLILTERGI